MKQPPVILNTQQREATESAIAEVCEKRGYYLRGVNARTNHVHSVVTAQMKPERIIDAFKAYATRKFRSEFLISSEQTIWSRGRSRRYLWKPGHVNAAIDCVLYSQGLIPFEIEEWVRRR